MPMRSGTTPARSGDALEGVSRAPAGDEAQDARLRAMTPAEKIAAMQHLYWTAWKLKSAAIRAKHPTWSDDEVHRAVRRIFLLAQT